MRRLLVVLMLAIGACALSALAARPLAAQSPGTSVRMEITGVADTTFTFSVVKQAWVKRGQIGMVVDPTRSDALVARFRVTGVANGIASAVVTGQTMPLATSHVVLLRRPPTRWYAQPLFWAGALLGGAVGLLVGTGL